MKKIYVYISRNNGSAIMKTNIFNHLNIQIINELIIDKDCIYYILKHISYNTMNILRILKTMNNYLIYEPLDLHWSDNNLLTYLENIKNKLIYFNHIICNNNYMIEQYRRILPKLEYTVIYHEYDMRFKPTGLPQPKIYYIGSLSKSSLTENICMKYDINIIDSNGNGSFINNNYTGIHIDYIKKNTTYYCLHTSTKLSTALCFNSIFICNRVPVYIELLGCDYEFYLNDNLSNLQEIINKAKDYITMIEPYNKYIENMKYIKEKLSYDNVSKEYHTLFNKFI